MKLDKLQWNILKSLSERSEPIEQVYLDIQEELMISDPITLLPQVLELYNMGHLTIHQAPLGGLGQSLQERDIFPTDENDVLGDLSDQYEKFREKRDYLYGFCGGGIPMGIYLEMTSSGRVEYNKEEYQEYRDVGGGPEKVGNMPSSE
ncbi:hypothetical protein ACFL0Q_00470 [Thermodesulfobacteriota bacterium]